MTYLDLIGQGGRQSEKLKALRQRASYSDPEAQAASPGRAGVGRHTPGRLAVAGEVTRLPRGELERAAIRTTNPTAIGVGLDRRHCDRESGH